MPLIIDGFQHFPGFFSANACRALLAEIQQLLVDAPLFQPVMPRTGKPFSVKMSNCGTLGWLSDKIGYRYAALHPVTQEPWPAIPDSLLRLWQEVADYPALPEACLINYYADGARMGSHRDVDEEEFAAPVVSISLGDDAVFHIGGLKRSDTKTRITLRSGDVVVMGGSSRRAYHGIDRVRSGTSDLLAGGGRLNLTLRRVTMP